MHLSFFEFVIVFVAIAGIVFGLKHARVQRTLDELGRHDHTWIEHPDARDVAEWPSEDDRDPPLPKRPPRLRPRPSARPHPQRDRKAS